MRVNGVLKKENVIVLAFLFAGVLLFGCTQQAEQARQPTVVEKRSGELAASVVATLQATVSRVAGASENASASGLSLSCSGVENGFVLTCVEKPPAGCENKNLGERADCKFPLTCFASKCAQASASPTPFFASSSPQASVASASSGVVVIRIKNFAFEPSEVVVKAGTQVVWVNEDSVSHTVTSDGGRLAFPDSATLSWNQRHTVVFSSPGTFNYHCNIHPNMKGKIIVVS